MDVASVRSGAKRPPASGCGGSSSPPHHIWLLRLENLEFHPQKCPPGVPAALGCGVTLGRVTGSSAVATKTPPRAPPWLQMGNFYPK